MATVENVLRTLGWTKSGVNYYYPSGHPHLHIHVSSGARDHDPATSIYRHVTMLAVSRRNGPATESKRFIETARRVSSTVAPVTSRIPASRAAAVGTTPSFVDGAKAWLSSAARVKLDEILVNFP